LEAWSHASSMKSLYESGQHSFLMCFLGHYIAAIKTSRCPLNKYGWNYFGELYLGFLIVIGKWNDSLGLVQCVTECMHISASRVLVCPWEKIWRYGWNDLGDNTSSLHISSDRITASLSLYQPTCNEYAFSDKVRDKVIDQAVSLIRPSFLTHIYHLLQGAYFWGFDSRVVGFYRISV